MLASILIAVESGCRLTLLLKKPPQLRTQKLQKAHLKRLGYSLPYRVLESKRGLIIF
jgi:hypothetical protein